MTDWSRRLVCMALLFTLPMNGCASNLRGATQALEITSDPSGIAVVVLPQHERVVTPATIKASRVQSVTLLVDEPGFRSMIRYVQPQKDLLAFLPSLGNLVFIAVSPFLLFLAFWIDQKTGATFGLSPNPVHLVLEPIPIDDPDVQRALLSAESGDR